MHEEDKRLDELQGRITSCIGNHAFEKTPQPNKSPSYTRICVLVVTTTGGNVEFTANSSDLVLDFQTKIEQAMGINVVFQLLVLLPQEHGPQDGIELHSTPNKTLGCCGVCDGSHILLQPAVLPPGCEDDDIWGEKLVDVCSMIAYLTCAPFAAPSYGADFILNDLDDVSEWYTDYNHVQVYLEIFV